MWTSSVNGPSASGWMRILTTCTIFCFAELRPSGRIRRSEFNSLDYLTKYGYLEGANLETGAMRSKAELDAAVREFQGMSGLEQTGQLDEKTIEKMQEPRCGIADMAKGPQQFVIGSRKWDKTDITYSIKSYTPDVSEKDTRNALVQALRMWSDESPLNFREVSGEEADIEISFVSRYHDDGYDFDGQGGVLAHAFPPGGGRGGDAHFDEDENWTVRSYTGKNLLSTAAHEFGHSLGIDHSNISGSLMYAWYQGYKPNLKLSSDDISAIQTLYGRHGRPPSGPGRVLPIPHTRSVPTTTRPTLPTVQSTRPRPPSDEVPNPCSSDVDSVTRIRGEVFAFKGKYFWRMDRNGRLTESPTLIRLFWPSLPEDLTSIDSVYERQDNKIIFFKGSRFWVMSGRDLAPGCSKSGRQLTEYGLDPGVTHVDAVFYWGMNRRGYIFSGYSYWRINKEGTRVESGYPKPTELWTGIPIPFDAVFTHFDGKTYFLKGTDYWLFNDKTMEADPGYPKPSRKLWTHCPRTLAMRGLANPLSSSSLGTLLLLNLFGIIQNLFW